MTNPFFKNTGPHSINFLLKATGLKNENLPNDKITDNIITLADKKIKKINLD